MILELMGKVKKLHNNNNNNNNNGTIRILYQVNNNNHHHHPFSILCYFIRRTENRLEPNVVG
jgi:hypothetical protein